MVAHHAHGEGRGIAQARVNLAETGKLGAHVGEFLARLGLLIAQVGQGVNGHIHGSLGLSPGVSRLIELRQELVGAAAAMLKRCAELIDLIVDLLQAARVHAVLDLGVGEGLLHLDELEGSTVGGALDLALLARESGDGLIELDPACMQLIGRGLESADIARGDLGCGALLVELTVDVGELLKRATALMLGAGERAAHLGKTGHHVAALLLEQSHVRPDSADHVLHMAALLAQVADEQPLLLEHDLKLLQLVLLLTQSVTGELQRGGALT